MKIRVTVADTNKEFLTQIVSLLEPEFEVISTATDGKTAFDLIGKDCPEVVVLDLRLRSVNGIEVIKRMASCTSQPAFVMCSIENDPDLVEAASRAGASGYVLKNQIATDLIPAIRAVARGERFISA